MSQQQRVRCTTLAVAISQARAVASLPPAAMQWAALPSRGSGHAEHTVLRCSRRGCNRPNSAIQETRTAMTQSHNQRCCQCRIVCVRDHISRSRPAIAAILSPANNQSPMGCQIAICPNPGVPRNGNAQSPTCVDTLARPAPSSPTTLATVRSGRADTLARPSPSTDVDTTLRCRR